VEEREVNTELNLNKIISTLWAQKLMIIGFSLFFAILSIFYSLSLPNIYTSQVILTPSDKQEVKRSSNFGGLSLPGLGVSSSGSANEAKIAVIIMNSWKFSEDLIRQNAIERALYASIGWDEKNDKLIFDSNILNIERNEWIDQPTSWELYQKLQSQVSITHDAMDSFIFISMQSYSPRISKKFVDLFKQSINSHMRERQISESSKNLEYLNIQLKKTQNSDIRKGLFSLIQEEQRKIMLAEANPEYSFITVSESMIPEIKSSPKRSIIVLSIFFFSFLVSCLAALYRKRAELIL